MIADLCVTRIGHISQKWSFNSSRFTYYVLLDANMLQMLTKKFWFNQTNNNLEKKNKELSSICDMQHIQIAVTTLRHHSSYKV